MGTAGTTWRPKSFDPKVRRRTCGSKNSRKGALQDGMQAAAVEGLPGDRDRRKDHSQSGGDSTKRDRIPSRIATVSQSSLPAALLTSRTRVLAVPRKITVSSLACRRSVSSDLRRSGSSARRLVRVAASLAICVVASWAHAARAARPLTFENRVKAQETIDGVCCSHEIGATQSFDGAVPRQVLDARGREVPGAERGSRGLLEDPGHGRDARAGA